MATKVKPSRLQVSWTPQAWNVPVYVDEDCFCWWAWWGWWGGCSEWWCITWTLCNQTDLQWALDCKANCSAIPTDNCQLSNGCWYTTCTGTLTASNISNTAYGSSWDGVTTVAPSKNAVYDEFKSINDVIPSAATCSNQLADKDYVNDSINSVTAYYITKNAQGDQFACYAELAAATTFYSGWVARTPTRNDYTIVADDECYNDATTRYIYNSGWEYQYTVNETPLTTAQMNALNSWITSTKVWQYDTAVATIWWYGDIVTHDASDFATSAQWGLADTALQPNDNVSELVNDAWYLTTAPVTSVNWSTWAVTVNDVKIYNSALAVASEWTVGYFTTDKNLAVQNWNGWSDIMQEPSNVWSTWDVITKTSTGYEWATPSGWGDAKVFTLSDLTSAASLTTATQAYTYGYTGGKAAFIYYSHALYAYAYGSTTVAYFARVYGLWAVSSGIWASVYTLKLTVASWSVTAIAQNTNQINISSSAPSSSVTNNTITLVI